MRSRVVGVLSSSLALVLLLLAGCSDDDAGPAAGSPASKSAATDASSDASSETGSPSIEPASGQLIDTRPLSFRLTEDDWDVSGTSPNIGAYTLTEDPFGEFLIGIVDARNSGGTLESLRTTRGEDSLGLVEARPDRTINGTTVLYSVGRRGGVTHYQISGLNNGYLFIIDVEHPTRWAEGKEAVESMLASIEWK